MICSREERLRILFAELDLIQGRFAKYDDLLWKSRSWAVVLVAGLLGWAISLEMSPSSQRGLLAIAVVVAGLFWLEEGLLAYAYVYKYVVRYRNLRALLNGHGPSLEEFPLYDLTNHIEGRGPRGPRVRFAFFRAERVIFFLILAVTPVVVGWVILS